MKQVHLDFRRRAMAPVAMIVAVSVSACSVTTYKGSVDTFATATLKANDALGDMHQAAVEREANLAFRLASAGKATISPADNTCSNGSNSCELWFQQGPRRHKIPSLSDSNLISEVMQGIVRYAQNLQAIVNSDAGSKVVDDFHNATDSIKIIAGVLKKNEKPANTSKFDQLATPVGNLIAWAAGEYVATVQVNALQKATTAANPVIQDAATALKGVSEQDLGGLRGDTNRAFDAAKDAYIANRKDRAAFDTYRAAAATYNAALQAKPSEVFQAMADAHAALTERLHGRHVTIAQASAAIQEFAGKAEQLWKLVQAIEAAAKPKTTGTN